MQQNSDTSEDVAMDDPLGGIMRGWPETRGVYERLFSGPTRVRVEFFEYTLHVSNAMFFAVGRERGQREEYVMGITLPAFTPIEESLFLTLCGRALDNRSPHPILGDTMVDDIVRKLAQNAGKN